MRAIPVVLADRQELRLAREYPGAVYNASASALEIPVPRDSRAAGGGELVSHVARSLNAILSNQRRPAARSAAKR